MGQIIKYFLMTSSLVILLTACPERKKIPPVPAPTPPPPETTLFRYPPRGMAPPFGPKIQFYQMLAGHQKFNNDHLA